jgi:hypothetical protein
MVPICNGRLIELDEKVNKGKGKGGGDGVRGLGDEEVTELLRKFEWLNGVRAGLMAVGGIVGLYLGMD